MLTSWFALLFGLPKPTVLRAGGIQKTLAPSTHSSHVVDAAILHALNLHEDPVDAMLYLQPDRAAELSEPRLLHIKGEDKPQWLTEGEKLRLRRLGKKFMDITDHVDFYEQQARDLPGRNEAYTPNLTHQRLIPPLFQQISTTEMTAVLQHMTSYYNRLYSDVYGEQSSVWLHDYIAKVIADSPYHSHISLEYFPHDFPQSSIIARFEPRNKTASMPLTVLGAHQDSANYNFPLLPAPGADDDCSGTVSILEAFRVLALSGYTPINGPVEFHWYAAEEAGSLGSQAIAVYRKQQGVKVGGMLQFDMTAFVAANATEKIVMMEEREHDPLANWTVGLSQEYIPLESYVSKMNRNAGSDHESWTMIGYPAVAAAEGDMLAKGRGWGGEFDPYLHTVNDTMYVNDKTGKFSVEHAAQFTKLAIAFAVEQAGWDNKWRNI